MLSKHRYRRSRALEVGQHGVEVDRSRAIDRLTASNNRLTADTCERTGRSERADQRDATRGKAFGEDLNRITGTSLDKGVELDALGASGIL